MLLRSQPQRTTIKSLQDEELAQLEHATPSPWADAATDSFSGATTFHPTTAANRHKQATSTNDLLPVIPNNNAKELIRRAHLSPRQSEGTYSSPAAKAYSDLVTQTQAMAITRAANMDRRNLHEQALQHGIHQLSADRVQQEKEMIRFNALKNEIDIFQQDLDPFVFEMRTPREHTVRSSVYRHFTRMQNVQDMGIPIYSLGTYTEEADDKFLTPRTGEQFYRRIRRRTAADFLDSHLVSRPTPPRWPQQQKTAR